MAVQIKLGQRRGVDAVNALLRDIWHQVRVQRVYPLGQDDVLGADGQGGPPLSLAGEESIAGQSHLPTCQQLPQLVVEKLQIQCFQRLEIVFSLRTARRLLAIQEVVIQTEGQGTDAVGQQLDGQPFGEGGLTRGRWAGDQC